ncbi:KNOX2-like protein [Cynara cardunculus var. scolymus]|uniref:KNOX2-like protein n=1 Tax=Cynara cardunculus var. scolymus TaxID=59895 RepID=A0A103XXU3_CYNCS|nr:KNOX2-like protein [Cynara cardunculus var. scolymus]
MMEEMYGLMNYHEQVPPPDSARENYGHHAFDDQSPEVGAPPDISNLFDEIFRDNDFCRRSSACSCLGDDPELDEFMETYCEMLGKYRSDLARPFDEATTFLNNMQTQLTNLCKGTSITYHTVLIGNEALAGYFYAASFWIRQLQQTRRGIGKP